MYLNAPYSINWCHVLRAYLPRHLGKKSRQLAIVEAFESLCKQVKRKGELLILVGEFSISIGSE